MDIDETTSTEFLNLITSTQEQSNSMEKEIHDQNVKALIFAIILICSVVALICGGCICISAICTFCVIPSLAMPKKKTHLTTSNPEMKSILEDTSE